MKMKTKMVFSISPRILAHLGEDLIKNESIALLELVKNTYDACSLSCTVEFITENKLSTQLKKLIITDDGFGMDRNIVETVWLTIGTDFKHKKIEPNKCGRIPLGEKGIGRLGVHKLGSKITLATKKENAKEVILKIDWDLLKNSETIDDFTIDFEENETPKYIKDHGTKIIIEDLKTSWDRREIRDVYRALNSLNSPFSGKNETFEVVVKSNSKELFSGLPDFGEMKESAMYFGSCKMEGFKITDFKYEFKPWNTLSKIDKGRTVDKLPVENLEIVDSTNEKNRINLDVLGIGSIEFEIIIFETDTQVFNFVNVEKSSLKEYLKENGGIRVYRDNIRVYDYGERDNDWLGIDLKRVGRVGGNVSNNIIIGAVKLDRSKSLNLREKTNREGFIENDAYYAFTEAINYALSLFVKERNIDKTLLTNLYKKHRQAEPVLSDLNSVIEIVEDENRVTDPVTRNELLKYLNRINTEYKQVKETLIKSANAGLNLSVVIHEIEKLIAALSGSLDMEDLPKAINISKSLEKIIHGYTAMIKKSSVRQAKLSKIIDIALDNYEFRFFDHSIKVISNHKDSELAGYLAEAESISMLANLLDNAIYWLSYARKENRMISIFITDQIKGYHSIVVSDNGPGFNMPFDVATEAFMTGKPHNIGSGLGLHISKEMMYAMKGQLLILEKDDIKFPANIEHDEINKAIVVLCFRTEKG
jgi:signal transduction histidine kinase